MKSDHPNVVFVLTDDQGYGDLSCHGNPVVKTPHIDALHATSMRLTDYHVGPTCAPTRAGLLTGHYANSTGVWHTIGGRSLLRSNEISMADYFRRSGYATGIFGKWHLGDNAPYRPQDRGFETVVVHGGGGVGQTLITGATTTSMTVTGTGKGIPGSKGTALTSGSRMR